MSITALRRVFERVESLPREARHAVYDAEGLDAEAIARIEAMLRPVADDAIAELISAAAEQAVSAQLPARIGPWRVLRQIGEGGMGIVVLAERDDGEYQRTVAIKLIGGVVSAGARERFRRERQALAALEHPNIAGLIDAGTTDTGEPYLVMPYVQGRGIGEWICSNPPLDARLRLFASICRAVHHAHRHLIVHRDIKPGNVIVRDDDTPVLLDFGIAKLLDDTEGASDLRTATRVMTPAYASPEQLLGQPVTTATDVFGLGMLLYELLVGSVPQRGDVARAASVELPPPSTHAARVGSAAIRIDAARLRGDLDRIVRCAVRSDPLQRYSSALALAEDIEAFLDGRPVQAAGAHGWYLARRFVQRHRWLVAAATVALIALASVSVQWRMEAARARHAQAEALREASAASGVTHFLLQLFAELDPNEHPGRQLSARELLDIGRQRLPDVDMEGPELGARLQAGLGWIYANIGEPLIAIELLEEADRALQADGATAARLQAQLALARAYKDIVRAEASEHAASAALQIARALQPPARVAEAEALMARGVAEQLLMRPVDAERSFIAAQAVFESEGWLAGLASVLHNRGWLAEARGDNSEALDWYAQALAAKQQVFPPDHPKLLTSLHGRGKALARLGRHAEAAEVFEDLLASALRVHGPGTDPAAIAQGELASVYHDLGRYEQAQLHYEQTLAVERSRSAGAPSMSVAIATNNLATLLEDRGDFADAVALYEESARIRVAVLPDGHSGRSNPLHNLARLLLVSGKHAEALERIDAALALRRAAFDESHPLRLSSELLRARILASAGDAAAARDAMATLQVPIERRVIEQPRLAIDHAITRASIAAAERDSARHLAALDEAIAASADLQGNTHPKTALLRLQRARARLEGGDRVAARAEAAAVAVILDAPSAADAPWRAELAELLAAP
jgi:eukaryotic-like serine/threonine-protein kinase